MTEFDLTLASRSPRRREILNQIGVRYRVASSDVAEVHQSRESPEDYVQRLAISKAQAVAGQDSSVPVLGADTIVVSGGQILEKPIGREHASEMLVALSGSTHQVISGVALVQAGRIETAQSRTEVRFRALTLTEIEAYWTTGEPLDKSGGYAIQGLGAVFVESIAGSYSNVVGLPIEALVPLLCSFNVPIWQVCGE